MVSCVFLYLVEYRFLIWFGWLPIPNVPCICLELFVLFHSNLSRAQVDWLSESIATTTPAPSFWEEMTSKLQLICLLLFLLLKTHTTNYSARSHFHNCACFWITACMQLWHRISLSNVLQGAFGIPQVLVKGYAEEHHLFLGDHGIIWKMYLVTPSFLNFKVILPANDGLLFVRMQWSAVINVVMRKRTCSLYLKY